MPMTTEQVFCIVSLSVGLLENRVAKKPPPARISAQLPPRFLKLVRNMKIAMGMMMNPMTLMKRFMEFMISEFGRLYFFARAVSLLI